jgi:hypothetical protein
MTSRRSERSDNNMNALMSRQSTSAGEESIRKKKIKIRSRSNMGGESSDDEGARPRGLSINQVVG